MTSLHEEMSQKVAVITGGNRGIGAGCAEAFCRYGARVVIAGRDSGAGTRVAAGLTRQHGTPCDFFRCDVSRPQEVQALVDYALERHGRLDCMINNAGYLPRRRPVDEISIRDFQDVLSTNLVGVFSGCKFSLPHLRRTGGSIINMSSVLGVVGQDGSSIYAATKAAIIALTKSLAMDEAEHGVRVNAVLPGNIRSELGKEHRDESAGTPRAREISNKMQWLRRQGEPLEIGTCCVFLASSMASYITGAEINVTGGFELGGGLRLTAGDLRTLMAGGEPPL